VGIKMLLIDLYHIPTPYALGFIAITLTISVIASIYYPKEEQPISEEKLPDE
jgi:tellurite resistance protein TerC